METEMTQYNQGDHRPLQEYESLLLPLFLKLGEVHIEMNPTGKSLLIHTSDERTFYQLANAALKGAKWQEEGKTLLAGLVVLKRAWERLRPVPPELVGELRTLAARLGLSVAVDQMDGRTVYLEGDWFVEESQKERASETEFNRYGSGLFLRDFLQLKKVPKTKTRYYARSEEGIKKLIYWFSRMAQDGVTSGYGIR